MELPWPEQGSLLAEADGVSKLPTWMKRDIQFLQKELESQQAVLRIIAEVPAEELDPLTKRWADDLRNLSSSMEELAHKFRAHIHAHRLKAADPRGLKGFLAGISFQLTSLKARHELTTSIRELKHRVRELAERRERYKIASRFDDRARRQTMTEDEGQLSHPDTEDLVGIDGHRGKLARILTEREGTSSQQLKVVAIVGDGPVGKTTLAKVVYDSLKQQFGLAAWVTVSSRPDIIKILRGMLRQISQEDQEDYIGRLDPKQLIDKIRRTLQDRRYLIVVDNVLDEPEWELLKCVLIDNTHGSAVLITSRKANHIAHFVSDELPLKPLEYDDSRTLFHRRVFSSGECPRELAEISEDFIKKFDGMPSTIISIARLLATKTSMTKDEWQAVYASIYNGLLFDQIIGHGFQRSEYELPPRLKHCLLYLSMFQKGSEINGEHLIRQWMAEDFINEAEAEGRTLQELGEHYLRELINRKLIEQVDASADGKALSCRVTGMVHDLIVSMSSEENFVTLLDGREINLPRMVQRLSIQGSNVKHPSLGGRLSQVKSLVVSGDADFMPPLSEFDNLLVMDVGGHCSLQNDNIKDIGNLFHLKCLKIAVKHITGIPANIEGLRSLETLDLRESGVTELPDSVFKLRKLKHLFVNSRTKMPVGIESLEDLQELGDMSLINNPEFLKEICCLSKLKVLRIAMWSWDGSYDEALLEFLRSLQRNIQSLTILTCCSLSFMDKLDTAWAPESLQKLEIRNSAFLALPRWMCSIQNLSSLSIEVYKLSQDIIDMIGQMSNLCSLSLSSKHAPEGKFCSDTGFNKLTGFHFASNAMTELFAPGAMQMLQRLKLSFEASRTKDVCEGFNFGLENLSSLQHIRVQIICFNASPQVVEKAEKEIQEAISRGCSYCQNQDIRRVREEDMIESEDEVPNVTQGNQKKTKNKKKRYRQKKR